MSLEQAILELAAAMREGNEVAKIAAENSKLNAEAAMGMVEVQNRFVTVQEGHLGLAKIQAAANLTRPQREEFYKDSVAAGTAGGNVLTPDTDLEEAVAKVEQKAQAETKKPAATPAAETTPVAKPEVAAESPSDATPLVYTTDVKPTLLALNKTKGRDALAGLLKKYDATNGDKIKQDDLALILADAKALLAA